MQTFHESLHLMGTDWQIENLDTSNSLCKLHMWSWSRTHVLWLVVVIVVYFHVFISIDPLKYKSSWV